MTKTECATSNITQTGERMENGNTIKAKFIVASISSQVFISTIISFKALVIDARFSSIRVIAWYRVRLRFNFTGILKFIMKEFISKTNLVRPLD